MKKNVLTSIVSTISYLLALVPLVTLAISWSSIPAVVPVHIGFDGKIDRWGSKWELIIVAVIIAVLSISIVTALRLSFLGNNRETVHVSKKGWSKGVFSASLSFILMEIIVDVLLIIFFGTVHANPVSMNRIISSGSGVILIIFGNIAPLLSIPSWFGLHFPKLRSQAKVESFVSQSAGFSALFFGIICVVLSFIVPLQYCGIIAFLCYVLSFILIMILWLVALRTMHDD